MMPANIQTVRLMGRMNMWIGICAAVLLGLWLLTATQQCGAAEDGKGVSGRDAPPPARTTLSDPAIQYTVPVKPYVVLRRGPVQIVVVDNRAVDDPAVLPVHRAGYSGIGSLTENSTQPVQSGPGWVSRPMMATSRPLAEARKSSADSTPSVKQTRPWP